MNLKIAALLILITFSNGLTFASEVPLYTWSQSNGELWQQSISKEKALKLQRMSAQEAVEKLSPGQAISIASEYVKRTFPGISTSTVGSVSLNQILFPEYLPGNWYYTVTFINGVPVKRSPPLHLPVVILMTGEAIDAKQIK